MSLFQQLHSELTRLATAWENESKHYNNQANELRAIERALGKEMKHTDMDIQAAHYTARSKELRDILKKFTE
jgi:ppGpp synthetase/RelA/SpoT-type nucleotidyltranferase